MPPETAALYIQSKHKHETLCERYLFSALELLLKKKPSEYYPNFPSWAAFCAAALVKGRGGAGRGRTYEEIMAGIEERLQKGGG